jgi:hypothetical protein
MGDQTGRPLERRRIMLESMKMEEDGVTSEFGGSIVDVVDNGHRWLPVPESLAGCGGKVVNSGMCGVLYGTV